MFCIVLYYIVKIAIQIKPKVVVVAAAYSLGIIIFTFFDLIMHDDENIVDVRWQPIFCVANPQLLCREHVPRLHSMLVPFSGSLLECYRFIFSLVYTQFIIYNLYQVLYIGVWYWD